MSASKIVTGYIQPIEAKDLLLDTVRVQVPLDMPHVFKSKFVSHDPLVMTQETLDHAHQTAQRMIEMQDQMPHTELSGDLLSMAYSILHYAGKERP
jgi:hypothetical protein